MLYHYTSLDTLVCLLNANKANKNTDNRTTPKRCLTFWASSIYSMNDPLEMKYGDDFLRKIIPALEKSIGLDMKLLDIIDNVKVCGQSDTKTQEQINNHFFNPQKTPFVLSFSHCEDDLVMWKIYGDNGKGVCLEFDDGFISELPNVTYAKDVNYGQELNDKILIDLLLTELKRFSEDAKVLDKEVLFGEAIKTYSVLLAIISPFVKNIDYSYEQEYRISFLDMELHNVDFRIRNNLIIPYLPANIPIKYLKQITLGPCCDEHNTKGLLHMLNALDLREFEDKIKKSERHYRQ